MVLGAEIGLVFAFLTEVLSVTSVRGPCLSLRAPGKGGDVEGEGVPVTAAAEG